MKKIVTILFLLLPIFSFADLGGVCSKYGLNSIEVSAGMCGCRSGYVMGKVGGSDYCVSGTSYCYGKYGYDSDYNSGTQSCTCRDGYKFGKNSIGEDYCVSAKFSCSIYGESAYEKIGGGCGCLFGFMGKDSSGNTVCVNGLNQCTKDYGINATYVSGSEKCSCQSGYEFALDGKGKTQCMSCEQIYGPNSVYFYLSQDCGCKDGYTVKDGKCELKSNSAYYILEKYDTSSDKGIVRAEYDGKKYLIALEYASGMSAEMSLNISKKIVINTGADFTVDSGDFVVINETKKSYKIASSELVDSDFSFDDYLSKGGNIRSVTIPPVLILSWQEDAKKVASKGFINTKSNPSDYNVTSYVLRQEIIAMAAKIKQLQLPEKYICKNIYKDVTSIKPNDWVCRTAEIAAENGMISKENKYFNPESNVTVAESLAIIFNAFGEPYKNFSTQGIVFPVTVVDWQRPIMAYSMHLGFTISPALANVPAFRGQIFNFIAELYKQNNSLSEFLGI